VAIVKRMINDKCFWGILLVLWGVTHFLEFCAPYILRPYAAA